MNALDIIILLLLLLAVWDGYRQGVIVQVVGLIALLAGVFAAWHFGGRFGELLRLEGTTATIVGFSTLFVVVMVVVALIGRLMRGLFRITGLGIFDRLLGVLFSLFKMLLVTGLLFMLLDVADPSKKLIKEQTYEKSVMYGVVMKVTSFSFPYVDLAKDTLLEYWDKKSEGEKRGENKI
jgi:membrane protein required for colicin V production